MKLFKLRIRQGRLVVMANNVHHAEAQAKALERDLARYWVRAQTHAGGDVYVLGAEAWRRLGQAIKAGKVQLCG